MKRGVIFVALLAVLIQAGWATAAPFYGPPTGASRKACQADGGSWVPNLQVCVR